MVLKSTGFGIGIVAVVLVTVVLVSCTNSASKTTPAPASKSATYVVESGASRGKRFNDNRYFAEKVQTESLIEDGLHDPTNPAISALQEPNASLAKFPQDRRGGVDWVRAIDDGLVEPRETLDGSEGMLVMDMDILFKDTGSMPWVRFPHLAHTRWLDCSNCHPKIFIPRKGANNPSMDGILAGEHCGRCHDKVAFSLWICERCHSVPHEKSPQKWW